MSKTKNGRPVGRPPGSVSNKRRMANEIIAALEKELGKPCHPLEGLLRIAADESQPMELRAACNRDALPYVLPKLQQQMIGVGVAGALELEARASVQIDLHAMMKDSKLLEAAQTLAMAVCEDQAAQIEAQRGPGPRLLEADYSD